MTTRKKPTQTLLAQARRAAKAQARAGLATHGQALEAAAKEAGYASWKELAEAAAKPDPDNALPLDPKLPKNFDFTPNEDRSKAQIKAWWDRPFAVSNPDGSLSVRCLDGGAWDRSTSYGRAQTMAEARTLADRKLSEWKAMRAQPVAIWQGDGTVDIARMSQKPGDDMETLASGLTNEGAALWLKERGLGRQ